MNHYYTRLSFEKLENFDMSRQRLSSFVLIRNSLITALTLQQQFNNSNYDMHEEYNPILNTEHQDILLFEQVEQEEEEQTWLDSCFDELQQPQQEQSLYSEEEEEEDVYEDCSSEEDDLMMPLSPQDHQLQDVPPFYKRKRPTFFINEDEEEDEEENGLVCYDIPFLSLVEG